MLVELLRCEAATAGPSEALARYEAAELAAHLTENGCRPIRLATVAVAVRELHAAGLVAVDVDDHDELAGCWSALPIARDPLLEAVAEQALENYPNRSMLRVY